MALVQFLHCLLIDRPLKARSTLVGLMHASVAGRAGKFEKQYERFINDKATTTGAGSFTAVLACICYPCR